jgi:hypothetical protein
MEYNGKKYTWVEFKEYWKVKSHGGWNFDDLPQTKESRKQIVQDAWMLAGPIYCKKHGLTFVPFNKSEDQRQESQSAAASIHYIFAVDDSGSMIGTPWNNLIQSLKETMEKIKAKDANKNKTKVSLMVFNSNLSMICENEIPSKVNTNPPFKGGGTNFALPFSKAAEIAGKYISNSVIVFIFMTDGGASYPS